MCSVRTLWLVPGLPPPRHLGLPGPCVTVIVLPRMIDWVSWPLGKNIDKWIIALLKGLAAVKKFSILIEVSLAKIEKVGGPHPALAPANVLGCSALARGGAGLRGGAPGLSPKLSVTWDNSLPLSEPQVPPFFPLLIQAYVCYFRCVCPSIHPIASCPCLRLSVRPGL